MVVSRELLGFFSRTAWVRRVSVDFLIMFTGLLVLLMLLVVVLVVVARR